jgi:hypothetical protein
MFFSPQVRQSSAFFGDFPQKNWCVWMSFTSLHLYFIGNQLRLDPRQFKKGTEKLLVIKTEIFLGRFTCWLPVKDFFFWTSFILSGQNYLHVAAERDLPRTLGCLLIRAQDQVKKSAWETGFSLIQPQDQLENLVWTVCCTLKTQFLKFEKNIPKKGTAQPESQSLHSCFCEQFIYSHGRSAYSAAGK